MNVNIKDLVFKDNALKNYALELLNGDFRVFVYNENKISWLIFSKGDNVGSVENNSFNGFSFCTKHKPNRTTGTGYQTETEIFKPTLQNALNTLILAPSWASPSDIKSIIKYKDIEDYLKQERVLSYVEVLK